MAAHLVARALEAQEQPDLLSAVRTVVAQLQGAYSLCFVAVDEPDVIVVAKHEAPLIVAHEDGVGYCASDVAALITHTRDVAALLDGQIARISPDGVDIVDVDGNAVEPHRYTVTWDLDAAEKQGYDHFMLKEIHEQPQAVADTLLDRFRDGRLHLDELRIDEGELGRIDKVFILACGTSMHAGMVGKLAIEHWAGIPAEVEVASEFRYRDPIVDPHTLVIALSQSGETIDTIAAAGHAKDQRAPVISLVNVVGSTLAREADGVLYTHAGPEVAVASTKAFTTQIVGMLLLGLYLAQQRGRMYGSEIEDILDRLGRLPDAISEVLQLDGEVKGLAERYQDANVHDVHRPPRRAADRLRGRPEAQGDQLPPRRGVRGRRDEARSHRADRGGVAGDRAGAGGPRVRQDGVEHPGGAGPRREGAGHRHGRVRRRARGPRRPRADAARAAARTGRPGAVGAARCSSTATTWRRRGARTSTSPATSPRP